MPFTLYNIREKWAYKTKKCTSNIIILLYIRYIIKEIINNKTGLPMKHLFVAGKVMRPSQQTINLIKQIAYTYRVVQINGRNEVFCLN